MKFHFKEIKLFIEYFVGGILMSLFTSKKHRFQNYNEHLIMQLKIKTSMLTDLNAEISIISF